jgi:DNA-binding response OmpR family regulator
LPDAAHVLVVEDDPSLAKLLATALTKAGYRVSVAGDGLEALVEVDRAQPKPQLLIVDIMIPELDGVSLVRALKTQTATKNIPVILVTSKTDAKTIAEGISAGAKFYVTKPFVLEDLLTKVKRAIVG